MSNTPGSRFRALPLTEGVPHIVEAKHRLDGSVSRYECELVARMPSLLVALFRLAGRDGPVDSYGLFWPRRPYLAYHLVPRTPGAPVRTRFDVVRDMRIGADEVAYTDLVLDLWVRDGVLEWEDEDEVADAEAAGMLGATDRARIEATRALLERRHARIIAEVRDTLAGLGRLPAG